MTGIWRIGTTRTFKDTARVTDVLAEMKQAIDRSARLAGVVPKANITSAKKVMKVGGLILIVRPESDGLRVTAEVETIDLEARVQ